jgi:hypothetical protein
MTTCLVVRLLKEKVIKGSYFIFPGGRTMFPDGAEQYIEKLSQYVPLKTGRTGLDMGCRVIC